MGTKVVVRNGNIDMALRSLKNDKDGSRAKLREKEYYTKPGVRRKQKKEQGIKNTRRRERMSRRYDRAA